MACILIVDDDPVSRKLLTLLLRNAGHDVLNASEAAVGLNMARDRIPDLILMDFQLPDMDGGTATGILKNDRLTAGIPVVLLTAMASADTDRAPDALWDAFLAKPVRYKELLGAVDSLLAAGMVSTAEHRPMPLQFGGTAVGAASGRSEPTASGVAGTLAVDVNILKALVGDESPVIIQFLREFRASASKIRANLGIASTARRAQDVCRLVHMLKSSSRIVGAVRLGDLCETIEGQSKAGDFTDALGALLPAIFLEHAAVDSYIDSYTASHTGIADA